MKNVLKTSNSKWLIVIIVWTFFITFFIGVLSKKISDSLPVIIAFFILFFIIGLGIFFDLLGVSVNVVDIRIFHAMAANKNEQGKYAVFLCKNAEKVSNFCNDVIGDICGIISGAIGSGIIYRLATNLSFTNLAIISALFTALISSFTIAGKAIGKMIAMESSRDIVLFMSKFIQFFQERLKINILGKKA